MLRTPARLLVGALVALALPASMAFAAAPTKNGNYTQTKGDRMVVNFHVSSDGKKIDMFSGYGKCNNVPFNPPITMKINKSGTFALTGKRKDVIGVSHPVVIRGKFTSATKASGHFKVDGKGCKGKKIKFSATLDGTGDGSPV